MDMPTPCQNCGELHDLNDLKETGEPHQMVCSDCFEDLITKCGECSEPIHEHYNINEIDDGFGHERLFVGTGSPIYVMRIMKNEHD